ncbi:hypothetical protein [Nocardioides lianchengensis]|uniref:Small secreted protein n=1 Tax=Nocardioides lianchengensis TaxID=1045774 RepID=A0A1G7B946_9ACTN|nr:hypothetical protein [Nocardioides lianchengensis]NYG10066.1 putative small secreted protein [Nocardioides lianchengensis]SDE23482.1 hypothetical protein SAMN05421872_11781 [Nocardioides lianchengensis]
MRRIGTWAAAIVLGAGALAACGGDDGSGSDDASGGGGGDSSYCDKLSGFRDTLQNTSDASSFTKFKDAAEELADEAPDEVSGDWEKIQDAFGQLEDKLEEAGLSIEDLDDPTALQSADPEAMATLQEELTKIGEDLDGAGEKISDHAESECDIDLDGSDDSASPSPSS